MKTRSALIGIGVLLLLVIVGGISYLWGGTHVLDKLTIARATPDQLAKAMSDDNFYGNWRESTLVVQGAVADVAQQNGDTVIHFKTSAIFQAYCDIGSATTSAKAGDTITVIAEGLQAERLTTGVELLGCQIVQ
jgi:hypothetical protein